MIGIDPLEGNEEPFVAVLQHPHRARRLVDRYYPVLPWREGTVARGDGRPGAWHGCGNYLALVWRHCEADTSLLWQAVCTHLPGGDVDELISDLDALPIFA